MNGLKFFRMLRRKSQWKLGMEAGITSYRLSQVECGRLQPTPEELQRLAVVLGATAEDLTRTISEESLLKKA